MSHPNRFACAAFAALVLTIGCSTKPADEEAAKDEAPAAAATEAAPEVPSAPPLAPGLARLLPAGTLAYVSVEDLRTTKKLLADTSAKKLYDEPEMQAFLAKPRAKLKQVMEEAELEGDFEFDDFFAGFGGQFVGALTHLGPGPDRQVKITAIGLAEVTDHEAATRIFDWAVEMIRGEQPHDAKVTELDAEGWRGIRIERAGKGHPVVTIALSGNVAMFAAHAPEDATVAAMLAGLELGEPLPDSPRFQEMTAKLSGGRIYTGYLRVDGIRDALLDIARAQGEDTAFAGKVIAALGIEGELAASAGLSITPPGMTHKLYVKAPRPRRGLFTVMPDQDLTDATRRVASADMGIFVAARFDLSAVMAIVREIVALSGGEMQMQQGLMQANAMLGVDVEKDLLGSMGSQVIVTTFPGGVAAHPVVAPYVGLAIAIDLTEPAKVDGILVKLLGMADMMLKAQGMPGVQQGRVAGATVRSANIAGVITPCVAVTRAHLLIAGSIETAGKLIPLLQGENAAPAVEREGFAELAKRVGGLDGPQMIYSGTDAPKAAASTANLQTEIQKALAQLPPEQAAVFNEWVDWSKMPEAGTFGKYQTDQLDVVHPDDDGLLYVGYGLLGGSGMPMIAGVGGISAGLMLPALATAREKARRTKCMSNLKQIGVACHVYSTDNQDRFPKSFNELRPRYIQDDHILQCPDNPGELGYAYVSGLDAACRPTWVIAFDLADNHAGEGRNVLYLDGHVEWMSEERFQLELQRTLDEARARNKKPTVLRGAEALKPGPAGNAGDLF